MDKQLQTSPKLIDDTELYGDNIISLNYLIRLNLKDILQELDLIKEAVQIKCRDNQEIVKFVKNDLLCNRSAIWWRKFTAMYKKWGLNPHRDIIKKYFTVALSMLDTAVSKIPETMTLSEMTPIGNFKKIVTLNFNSNLTTSNTNTKFCVNARVDFYKRRKISYDNHHKDPNLDLHRSCNLIAEPWQAPTATSEDDSKKIAPPHIPNLQSELNLIDLGACSRITAVNYERPK